MKIDLQVDISKAQTELKKTQLEMIASVQRSLLKTAQYGTQIILDRTERGFGYDGKFAEYSASYRKMKAAGWPKSTSRRSFGGDKSGVVNLTVHGEMLSSIQQRSLGPNVAEIFFGRATEAKKAAFNNSRRRFFGFNSAETDRLSSFFRKDLK